MEMPPESEILAVAEKLGVELQDGKVPQRARAGIVNAILTERWAEKNKQNAGKPKPGGELLSRTVTPIQQGHIVVEVRLVQDPP